MTRQIVFLSREARSALAQPEPEPQDDREPTMLLLSVVGKTKGIIFKVAKWDPTQHPKGAKGLFIETPNKAKAADVVHGDVITTKSGKVFQVEKQTEKGVKVNPVDINTGEVQSSYTVLGNEVDVAVVEGAKAHGTAHAVSDLAPGTFIKTKAGKRFKVSKHGKWTTVYPVDANGNVTGKHTVLPPDTVVKVDAPKIDEHPSPASLDKLAKVLMEEQGVLPGLFKKGDLVKLNSTTLVVVGPPTAAGEGYVAVQYPGDPPDYSFDVPHAKLTHVAGPMEFQPIDNKDAWTSPTGNVYDIPEIGDAFKDAPDGTLVAVTGYANDEKTIVQLHPLHAADSVVYEESLVELKQHYTPVPEKKQVSIVNQPEIIYDTLVPLLPSIFPPGGDPNDPGWDPEEDAHDVAQAVIDAGPYKGTPKEVASKIIHLMDSFTDLSDDDSALIMNGLYLNMGGEDKTWPLAGTKHEQPKYGNTPEAMGLMDAMESNLEGIYSDLPNAYNDAATALTQAILKGPFTGSVQQKVNQFLGAMGDEMTKVGLVMDAVDIEIFAATATMVFQNTEDIATPKIQKVEPPSTSMLAKIVASEWGIDDEGVHNMLADVVTTEWTKDQFYNALLYLTNQMWEGEDDQPSVDKAKWDALFDLHSNTVYEGEPDTLAVAKKTLALWGYNNVPQHSAPIWKSLQVQPGPTYDKTPETATTMAELEDTPAWHMAQNMTSTQKLDDLMQENLAMAKAKVAVVSQPKVQEVLPTKLPKVPQAYSEGVGQHTRIVVEVNDGSYLVVRVDANGNRQILGNAVNATAAKKTARAASADHEPIEIVTRNLDFTKLRKDAGALKQGNFAITPAGHVVEILDVAEKTEQSPWSGGDEYVVRTYRYRTVGQNTNTGEPFKTQETSVGSYYDKTLGGGPAWLPVTPDRLLELQPHLQQNGIGGTVIDTTVYRSELARRGYVASEHQQVLRKARPERFNEYLMQDWNQEMLVGQTVNEALKVTNKLGYREIKPRQKDAVRVVNAYGKRLILARDGNLITGVSSTGAATLNIDGDARRYHDQLREVLDTGGDITTLDPANLPPEARSSHARQLLFDMALGKVNGVAEKIGKTGNTKPVKTDQAYLDEIEAEGGIGSLEDFKQQVDRPPYSVTSPRSASQEQFGGAYASGDGWTMTPDVFQTTESLDAEEATALAVILKRGGIAKLFGQQGEPATLGDFLPEYKTDNPIEAARFLARAWRGDDMLFEALPGQTVDYIRANLQKFQPLTQQALDARETEWVHRATSLRASTVQTEIDTRRVAEGTIPHAPSAASAFDLPVWDEIEFQEQSFAQVNQLTAEIGTTPHDVPAFYTGGVFQDGVLMHRSDWSYGKIPLEMDGMVMDRLQQLGATEEQNRDPIDPGYVGTAKLYDGFQLTLVDQTQDGAVTVDSTIEALKTAMIEDPENKYTTGVGSNGISDWDWVFENMAEAKSSAEVLATWTSEIKGAGDQLSESDAATLNRAISKLNYGEKRIEYVYHGQPGWNVGGAPTNQRGAFRMVGYTPEEAAARLKELGLLGDLEPEVPFKSLMRSTRRYGMLAPLHPAYVRGEEPLPTVKARLTHGNTAGNAMDALQAILRSGGLMSIHERHRQGILASSKGASVSGDVRSGIDHAVFVTTDGGGAVGSTAGVRFVLKPQAYLRRDITLADYDYGGMDTRYERYKKHLNGLQAEAGVPKTNLYEPVHPKVRQLHINKHTAQGNSDEYNIGPAIPIEDMEYIGVPSSADKATVDALLDAMLADGRIAARPKVVLNQEITSLSKMGVDVQGNNTNVSAFA